jgi:glycosyltransferase involved in cell wall biosynthesis
MIATNVGGVAEILHAKNGILIPSEDKAALVEAMKAIQEHHFDAAAMHQEAQFKYSAAAIAAQLQAAYHQVLKPNVS